MDETEIAQELKRIKADYEGRALILRRKIDRAKRAIARSEARLEKLGQVFRDEVRDVSRSFVGLPDEAETAVSRRRTRRWSLDEPIRALVRSMSSGVIALPDVCTEWARRYPDRPVSRTTIRGTLDRLVQDKELKIINQGGPGRSRAREYRHVSVASDPAEEEGIPTN
jgi:hypothetical protein